MIGLGPRDARFCTLKRKIAHYLGGICAIFAFIHFGLVRPKKKDSCVQVSEVKKIRVGRSKNIVILDFFFITNVQRL